MNYKDPSEVPVLPSPRLFFTALLASMILALAGFWLVTPSSMTVGRYFQVVWVESGFWYAVVYFVILFVGVMSLAKHCGLISSQKSENEGRVPVSRKMKFSFKYRVLMTLRNKFIELMLGLFLIIMGSVQLRNHEAWPDSSPIQPVIPFVAIYWVMIAVGVGVVVYAYITADKD